jgi:hypothetical protein
VNVFTAYESADLLMHYLALSSDDKMMRAMLKYTERYVEAMRDRGLEMTGHFSMDFLVNGDEGDEEEIYPIECNPRAHTALVNFSGQEERMIEEYLNVFSDRKTEDSREIVVPSTAVGHYWIGHDLVTRFFLPLLAFLSRRINLSMMLGSWE